MCGDTMTGIVELQMQSKSQQRWVLLHQIGNLHFDLIAEHRRSLKITDDRLFICAYLRHEIDYETNLIGGPELLDGVTLEQGLHQPDNYGRTDKVRFNI